MAVFNMVRGKVDLKNGVRMGRPKRVVRGLDSNHNRVIKMTGNKKKQGRGRRAQYVSSTLGECYCCHCRRRTRKSRKNMTRKTRTRVPMWKSTKKRTTMTITTAKTVE